LERFRWIEAHNLTVKLIHVIRNPFDNIATMARRLTEKVSL
jgi:hypothetical protein